MRLALVPLLAVLAALATYLLVDPTRVMAWAIAAQRSIQNEMAGAVRALQAGDSAAYIALLSGAAAYGFVHAVGPGHGKYLVGGVGLGSSVSALRLVGLAIASSLAQSLWAILLVYGGFYLFETTAQQLTGLAEDVLAPASYLAIAGVGLMIAWRGTRALVQASRKHADSACSCHAHGVTPTEAERATSFRESIALILSIAVRPCTGAIFLLVIAWQMDLRLAGAAAVFVMGLGTSALTSLVAVSSIMARRFAQVASHGFGSLSITLPVLQISAGTFIALISLGFLSLNL